MKARITFVLFAAAIVFAGTAMAATPATDIAPLLEEAPPLTVAEAAPAVESLEEPLFLAPSPGLDLCPHPKPYFVNCSHFDRPACGAYVWDCECCCVPSYVEPGAACPKVCY